MINYKKILFTDFKLSANDAEELERGFLLPLMLVSAVLFFLSAVGNLLLNFGNHMVEIPLIGSFLFLMLYFLSRKTFNITPIKWIFIVLILIFINLVWFFNYGSEGPWVYMIVLLFSYLIFMLNGWQLFWAVLIIVANIGALYAYDYLYHASIGSYPSSSDRIVDSYVAVLIYFTISYVLMSLVKNYYYKKYHDAVVSDQLKSSFLTNMSHEIRTPLNAIVGFSNLLVEGNLSDEERKSYKEIINNGNQSLMRLVDDILDVSLIESGQLSLNEEDCEVNAMMDKLNEVFKPMLKEKDLSKFQLICELPEERVRITVDCGRLQQILVNLIENAIKFTEEGAVTYGFTLRQNALNFFVKDTGIGIEDQHLEHLFDKFYKVEDDNRKLYRGTGMGLFLVKKLVGYLGGHIAVHSVFGQGTQFSFDIPAKNLKMIEPELPEEVPDGIRRSLKDSVFLVVEDDKVSSLFLQRILKNENIQVLHAPDGITGLKIFKEHPEINLVLLDIKMPGMDGFAVLKEMRKINNKVPIIAQTAMAMIGDRQKCLDAGFSEYVSKPLNANVLMKKILKFIPSDSKGV